MQSTGQGATHSSQPEHSVGRIACMRFCAPMIASTGHASMHSVQPMHADSSMTATRRGPGVPHAGSIGLAARPVSAESAATTASPPGGQRSMSVVAAATASAYGRQPAKPQRVHCVCGRRRRCVRRVWACRSRAYFTVLLDCCERSAAKGARRLNRCLPTHLLPRLTSIAARAGIRARSPAG